MSPDEMKVVKSSRAEVVKVLQKGSTLAELQELTDTALGRADRIVEQINGNLPKETRLVCQEGCAYCCHLPIDVSPPEVICIAEDLKRRLAAPTLSSVVEEIVHFPAEPGKLKGSERVKFRLPCPLLFNDRCRLYPLRPLMCRAYNSVDLERCRLVCETGEIDIGQDRDSGAWRVIFFAKRMIFLLQLGICAGLRASGYSPMMLDFSAALGIALQTEEVAEEWLAGNSLFLPAQIIDEAELDIWLTDLK